MQHTINYSTFFPVKTASQLQTGVYIITKANAIELGKMDGLYQWQFGSFAEPDTQPNFFSRLVFAESYEQAVLALSKMRTPSGIPLSVNFIYTAYNVFRVVSLTWLRAEFNKAKLSPNQVTNKIFN